MLLLPCNKHSLHCTSSENLGGNTSPQIKDIIVKLVLYAYLATDDIEDRSFEAMDVPAS